MILKEIKIKKVHKYFDKTIVFQPNVNYLIGINGSGKTTIIDIINNLFDGNISYFEKLEFEEIYFKYELDSKENEYLLKKENLNEYKEFMDRNEKITNKKILNLGFENEEYNREVIDFFKTRKQDENIVKEELYKILSPIEKVKLMLEDEGKWYLEEKNSLLEQRKKELEKHTKEIDSILDNLFVLNEFKEEKLKLKALKNIDVDVLEKYMERKTKTKNINSKKMKEIRIFLRNVNEFFTETNKKIDFNSFNGSFSVKYKKKRDTINFANLSSGEKQILIILATIYFSKKDHFIVLMDEPENSLHMSWQKKLMKSLKELIKGKNIQFIVATHSPDITRYAEEKEYIPFYPVGVEGGK